MHKNRKKEFTIKTAEWRVLSIAYPLNGLVLFWGDSNGLRSQSTQLSL